MSTENGSISYHSYYSETILSKKVYKRTVQKEILMRPGELKERYQSLSDSQFNKLDRDDLTPEAQTVYDEELKVREQRASEAPEEESVAEAEETVEEPQKKNPVVKALETIGLFLVAGVLLYFSQSLKDDEKKEEQAKFNQQMNNYVAQMETDQINNDLTSLQMTHKSLDESFNVLIKSVNYEKMTDQEMMLEMVIGGAGLTTKERLQYMRNSYKNLFDSYMRVEKQIADMGGENPDGLVLNRKAAKENMDNIDNALLSKRFRY